MLQEADHFTLCYLSSDMRKHAACASALCCLRLEPTPICICQVLLAKNMVCHICTAPCDLGRIVCAGSPGGMKAGFAAELQQGRPQQQADIRSLPTASSHVASSVGREVAELRQQVAELQAQNWQLLQTTRQQQATITSLQVVHFTQNGHCCHAASIQCLCKPALVQGW